MMSYFKRIFRSILETKKKKINKTWFVKRNQICFYERLKKDLVCKKKKSDMFCELK